MAFPVIQTADSQHGVVTSNTTTFTLTYPTNLVSGDLIIAFIGRDGGTGIGTWPAGWVVGQMNATATCLITAKKLSDGTETGTFNVTGLPSEQGGWRVLRITGWEGTIGTSLVNGVNAGAVPIVSSTNGTDANPNLASGDPANWDVDDTLWIAACSVDTSRTFSAWPSGYSPGDSSWDDVSGGAGGASLSVAWKNSAAASEDPGAWTISTADDWAVSLFAVRPVASTPKSLIYQPGLQAAIPRSLYTR